jgi:hypothetical protein
MDPIVTMSMAKKAGPSIALQQPNMDTLTDVYEFP